MVKLKWLAKNKQDIKKFWCTMDLANCFTTINHSILRQILFELFPANRFIIIIIIF